MIVSEAFERYIFDEIRLKGGAPKTAQNYVTIRNSFIECNGDIPVELISYDTVIRWKMQMDYKGLQLSTISEALTKLRQVLKYLRKRGITVIDSRDIELPRVPKKEAVWLEPAEIRAMLDECTNPRDKAIVAALFSSGGRISEVLSLNVDSIQGGKAQVVGKGSKLITLNFDMTALRLIDEYMETRRDRIPALFISGQYRRITVSRVEQIIHVLAAEAGIEKNVTPHSMRHSFATDLLMNGADLTEVKEQLHHSSITTTQIYTHYSQKRNKETYQKRHTVL